MTTPTSTTSTFIEALSVATVEDIAFSEEPVRSHPDSPTLRRGYKATAVRGVPVPNPDSVVYVQAIEPTGTYWYLLDWTRVADSEAPQPVDYPSEFEVKEALLAALKTAFGCQM